jgi:hypothetical protein
MAASEQEFIDGMNNRVPAHHPTEPTLGPFVRAVWESWLEGYTLDGGALQDLFEEHGLTYPRPATAEEAERADCDEGDTIFFLTAEAKAAIGIKP